MALSTASNWLWNFLLAFFTPFIVSAIDFQYGYVFAGCNVLGGLLIYFFVMEGQGRTLEEVRCPFRSFCLNMLMLYADRYDVPLQRDAMEVFVLGCSRTG